MFLTEFNQEEYEADVWADGFEIGRAEGREQGRAEGRAEERIRIIKGQIGWMRSRNCAEEDIVDLLGLTAEEQAEFL